jgi:hypothetical protein
MAEIEKLIPLRGDYRRLKIFHLKQAMQNHG